NRWRKPSFIAATVEHLANSADVDRVALENLDQGLLELGGARPVEQREQTGGDTADVLAALGEQAEERLAGWSGFAKAINAAVVASTPLLLREPRQVLLLLDLLIAVPGTDVRSNHRGAVENANRLEIGHDGE